VTTKDIEVTPHAPPVPPTGDPPLGRMDVELVLHESITEEIVDDLMRDIADNLQQVTHLINYAYFAANVGGVIIKYETPILPAMTGDLAPTPQWVETGEQTVNAQP
jgi:hypothetical protein